MHSANSVGFVLPFFLYIYTEQKKKSLHFLDKNVPNLKQMHFFNKNVYMKAARLKGQPYKHVLKRKVLIKRDIAFNATR